MARTKTAKYGNWRRKKLAFLKRPVIPCCSCARPSLLIVMRFRADVNKKRFRRHELCSDFVAFASVDKKPAMLYPSQLVTKITQPKEIRRPYVPTTRGKLSAF
jgi:hypothetical protein